MVLPCSRVFAAHGVEFSLRANVPAPLGPRPRPQPHENFFAAQVKLFDMETEWDSKEVCMKKPMRLKLAVDLFRALIKPLLRELLRELLWSYL